MGFYTPMLDVKAIEITDVEAAAVADDGRHALLKLDSNGQQMMLALRAGLLLGLMQLLSSAAGKIAGIEHSDPAPKHMLPCEWWEFGLSPDGHLFLSFRLPGGMEVSFQVGTDQIPHMQETLGVIAGDASTLPPPGMSRQ